MLDHQLSTSEPSARRIFLSRLFAGAGAVMAGMALPLHAQQEDRGVSPEWMKSLTGRHRTVLDVAAHRNGKPLAQAKNYLDAWRDAFRVPESDISLVLGIHGDAIPFVLSDATWNTFAIGAAYEIVDAGTRGPARRNVFTVAHAADGGLVKPEQTVDALQKRGMRVIVCNNTIAGAAEKLAAQGKGQVEQIKAALTAGLLPDVRIVPAMVVALTQLQEAGLKYTKLA